MIDVFSMIQGGAGMTDFRPQSLHPSGGDDHGPVQPSQTLGFADWVESTGAGVQDDRSLAANRLHVRDDLTEPNATDVYDEYGALVAPGMTQVERDAAELAKFKP